MRNGASGGAFGVGEGPDEGSQLNITRPAPKRRLEGLACRRPTPLLL